MKSLHRLQQFHHAGEDIDAFEMFWVSERAPASSIKPDKILKLVREGDHSITNLGVGKRC